MSYVDLSDAISYPKTANGNDTTVVTFYDHNGKSNKALNDETASAAIYTYKTIKTFKVKAQRTSEFFNPIKSDIKYGLDKRDRLTNESMFRWKIVSEKSFKNYIQFLKERHDSLLIVAEREA
jgi:hypothetical protein